METKYFIVTNKQKKPDQEQAGALLYELNNGGMILSEVPAGDSVHYVVGSMTLDPSTYAELNDEDAAVIRDNLSVTHPEKKGE